MSSRSGTAAIAGVYARTVMAGALFAAAREAIVRAAKAEGRDALTAPEACIAAAALARRRLTVFLTSSPSMLMPSTSCRASASGYRNSFGESNTPSTTWHSMTSGNARIASENSGARVPVHCAMSSGKAVNDSRGGTRSGRDVVATTAVALDALSHLIVVIDGPDDVDEDGWSNADDLSRGPWWVQPFNPCLPYTWSRTCDRHPGIQGASAPFDGSPNWFGPRIGGGGCGGCRAASPGLGL